MRARNAWALAGFVAVSEAAGLLGAAAVAPAVPSWYAGLLLPPFAPPSWVFGPVWTVLYALMGAAAFLVWRSGAERAAIRSALRAFWAQLALNAAWTPIFFGLRRIDLALIEIVVLLAAVAVTARRFARVRAAAGWLLAPYLLWVAFATMLTWAIWIRN